ncbi:hypothetical protein GCM10009654_16390 [Streptomyces hebeiensis]|uniref:DUF7848 domain-containing protein n=1 Tax=Streptomyces hebeiensis TaxID=229486 RepID=A0ABN1UR58_9ACTN
MSGEDVPSTGQNPPPVPAHGALMVDTSRGDRVGEFRGLAGPYWSLRPVGGGHEWEAEPRHVRPPTVAERLRIENARQNARSRGDAHSAVFTAALASILTPERSADMGRRHGFVDWTITPNRAGDPPTLHTFRCAAESDDGKRCGAQSPTSELFETARGWTFSHVRDHPQHTDFTEVIQRPWTLLRTEAPS